MINDAQKLIIEEGKTPAAVIAGPGTGKTFTIVKKVVDLVKNHNIAANKILITTFTKKAAAELNTRIITEFKKEGINTDLADLKIGNFHNLANIFLADYKKLDDKFFDNKVIEPQMEGYLLERNIEKFYPIEGFKELINGYEIYTIQDIFAKITNNLIDLKILESSSDKDDRLAYEIYKTHLKILEENHLLNFQMILRNFYDLLSDPHIGPKIRENIDYVIIDEYQDTNYIQQEIAFKLLKNKNIMVFGDDDQALYRFRGADPKNLLNFDEVCREKLGVAANFYKLNVNYRSNQAIIDLAQDFINDKKKEKALTKNLLAAEGEKNQNTIVRAKAENLENLTKIIKILNKDINLNQIAFLFPTLNNSYAKNLQSYLEKQGLPVINKSSTNFFDSYEIKVLMYIFAKTFTAYPSNLAYQKDLSIDELDKLYFRRYIANLFDDQSFKSTRMDKFIAGFQNTKNISLSEVLYKSFNLDILKEILSQKLDSLASQKALNNIAIFSQKVSEYEELFDKKSDTYYIEFVYGYLFYLYKTKAIKEFEDLPETSDAINFMTIHNAKGLEFDVVFVSGLNDYPRADRKTFLSAYEKTSANDDGGERDFYRKYYTAFTRAKKLLVVLDNSRDTRLIDFASTLPASSALKTIDFKKDEPKKKKPILAYTTDIEVYDACPLKYKFLRKLSFRLPLTKSLEFGTNIHKLSEYLAKNPDLDLEDEFFIDLFANNPAYKTPLENFKNKDFAVKASEVNFKADRDFYILQGNVDLILDDGSILDIKTGDYDKNTLEKYQNQVLTYKFLMEYNREDINKLYLYFVNKDELKSVEDRGFAIDFIDAIAKSIIDNDIYRKTTDKNECKYCPMKYYCDRYW